MFGSINFCVLNSNKRSRPEEFCKKRCSKKFSKMHRKTPVPESFLIKLQAEACNFIKKETLAQVFSVNFEKFVRTLFPIECLRWLLLFKQFFALSSHLLHRSSRMEVFCEKGVPCSGSATSLKKRLWHRCFPVNFTTFLRKPYYRTPPVAASKP